MGRPKGSTNDRLWRDAIRKAALERDPESKQQYITLAARATVRAAATGDQHAAKEMGDRLDGKAPQALIGGNENDPALRIITEIRRSIVDPRHSDS